MFGLRQSGGGSDGNCLYIFFKNLTCLLGKHVACFADVASSVGFFKFSLKMVKQGLRGSLFVSFMTGTC